jgi:hypothetical protein
VIINDEEIRANDGEPILSDVKYEVEELLRSGYYEVEKVEELDEGIS